MRASRCRSFRGGILFGLAVVFAAVPSQAQEAQPVKVKIQVDPKTVLAPISPDFIGLGYETSAVAQANYFSGKNAELIQLYRNLSDRGLIRIGGIISDHTQYVPDGAPAAHDAHQVTIITRKSLADLGEFTRATGWNVMWGLNLGTGTKEEAAAEAVAVDTAPGQPAAIFPDWQRGGESAPLQKELRRLLRGLSRLQGRDTAGAPGRGVFRARQRGKMGLDHKICQHRSRGTSSFSPSTIIAETPTIRNRPWRKCCVPTAAGKPG